MFTIFHILSDPRNLNLIILCFYADSDGQPPVANLTRTWRVIMTTQLINIFQSGGVFMWPIAVLSVAALAIILARIVSTVTFHLDTNKFLQFLRSRGTAGRSFFDMSGEDLFRMPVNDMEMLVEQELQMSFDGMFKNLEYLSAIGAVAPLLGFIGTVSGMIASFQTISTVNKVSVRLVAGGISEALITTGFGLIVAVVCIAGENIFRFFLTARSHRLTEEITLFTRDLRMGQARAAEASLGTD
jgi:biopolymer transport protein ExbB